MFKTTSFDIWRKEQDLPRIITLIKELDDHMGGGLPLGIVTELCGAPGVGKTQFCLQLCINVQFPELIGGLGAKAYFIDTNQGFSPFRLKGNKSTGCYDHRYEVLKKLKSSISAFTAEIADHMERRFQHTFDKLYANNTSSSSSHNFKATNILQNISYVYCSNYIELMASILNIRNIFKEDTKLKLIIIDSFSFTIRQLEDVSLRTRIVYEILTDLQALALEFNVAIIITNELTTRYVDNNWLVAPALGDSHTHKINQRLILSHDLDHDYHVVMIDKSVEFDKIAIRYKIKSSGIRSLTK